MATPRTVCEWPVRVSFKLPEARSHTLMVRSALPVANHSLLTSIAIQRTHPKWPAITRDNFHGACHSGTGTFWSRAFNTRAFVVYCSFLSCASHFLFFLRFVSNDTWTWHRTTLYHLFYSYPFWRSFSFKAFTAKSIALLFGSVRVLPPERGTPILDSFSKNTWSRRIGMSPFNNNLCSFFLWNRFNL